MYNLLLFLPAIGRVALSLAGAFFWERTTRRFIAVKPGYCAAAARLALFGAGLLGPLWIGDENILLFLPAFIGVFLLCYQGCRAARVVVGLVFYLLATGTVAMLDTALDVSRIVMDVFSPASPLYFAVGWKYTGLAVMLLKVAAAALVWLLARRLHPQPKAVELPGALWGLCALLSLAPLFMLLSFSLWHGFGRGGMDAAQYKIAYTVLPFVVLSALALLVALVTLSRQWALEQAAQAAQLREVYYQGLQSRQNRLAQLRHDLRNHLGAVQGLLAQGETEQAKRYLAELNDSPALHGTKRVCENELVNVVLTAKLEEMQRCGLHPDVAVTLPKQLAVTDLDLCALFGNALDNAIEAAQKAADKTITVRARADRGMLMLRVQNSFSGTLAVAADGGFASTKQQPQAHGLGLRGMQEIAARYNGTLQTSVTGQQFELIACLPLR